MTQKEISPLVELLGLQPHVEGGWYKRLWNSEFEISQEVLGDSYSGSRHSASSIYFLLHEGEQSDWHTVLSDEVWLWHSGSPIVLSLGGNGDKPEDVQEVILGLDIAAGQRTTSGCSSGSMAGRAFVRQRADAGILYCFS